MVKVREINLNKTRVAGGGDGGGGGGEKNIKAGHSILHGGKI